MQAVFGDNLFLFFAMIGPAQETVKSRRREWTVMVPSPWNAHHSILVVRAHGPSAFIANS